MHAILGLGHCYLIFCFTDLFFEEIENNFEQILNIFLRSIILKNRFIEEQLNEIIFFYNSLSEFNRIFFGKMVHVLKKHILNFSFIPPSFSNFVDKTSVKTENQVTVALFQAEQSYIQL